MLAKLWLGPEPRTRLFLISSIVLIALAITANVKVRHFQLQDWSSGTPTALIFDTPSFSTADAPYFLSQSIAFLNGGPSDSYSSLRSFPNNNSATSGPDDKIGPRNVPLLSFLIARLAGKDDAVGLLVVGNRGLLVASALTTIAVIFCFGASGYWTQGAIAGLGGGLSSAYLMRSSIGRIDTDQLNLGFMYLMFGLVVFAGRASSRLMCFIWCVVAGLSANLFMWWYGKEELIVMAAITLVWLLACIQRNFMTVLAGTSAFLAISGIDFFNPFQTTYLKEVLSESNFVFPNTYKTITEIQRVSFSQILYSTTGSIEMGIVCLIGLAFFFVRHPVVSIAYSPLVVFSLLNFIIGNRAIFYSAPIMWFGAAFLITTTARFIAANLSETGFAPHRDQAATVLAAFVGIIVAWVNSPTDYVPRPSFPKPVLEGLASLRSTANPSNSVVATWWDYGYASMFFNNLPTFHDGGTQTTPSTHFVAAAFLNADQTRTIGNLKFLSTKGHEGIAEQTTIAGLKTQFSQAINVPSPDLYLVVTGQMAGWMGSISQIGNWNIETGTCHATREQ